MAGPSAKARFVYDGPNWYAYVHNDPLNATDPTGEAAILIGALVSVGLESAIMGLEAAAGKEFTASEVATRLGSSAVAGAVGVGIVTKVRSVGRVAGALQKVELTAGNGNSIKVGNALAGGFEGAVSGATSHVVGAEINQTFGVGDGASVQSTAAAATIGGLTGGLTGSATQNGVGAGQNGVGGSQLQNAINAQAGVVEFGSDAIYAVAEVFVERERD